jgi:hypothetical protein
LAVVHAVMVSVMNMASLHLHHGGATLRVVGLVISVHLAGMFLLARCSAGWPTGSAPRSCSRWGWRCC